MRKILLIAASLLMAIGMMAAGKNDGSTKANAIDFKWTSGHTHEAGATLWYRVGLSELKKEQDPTLSLYLTNLSKDVAKVTLNLRAELMGEKADKQYSYEILSGEHKIWQVRELSVPVLGNATLKNLMDLGLEEVYIVLASTEQIKMTANAVETEEIIDDACTKAVPLDLTKGATVPAGEKWFYVNLMNVKNSENQLNFVVKNNGAGEANVSFDLSLDCPATYMIENDWKVASGSEATTALGRVFLDFMRHDFVYLRLTNDQPIALSVEEVKAPVVENFDENAMRFLELDAQHNLPAGAHVFEAYLEDLIAKSGYVTEYTIVNNNDAPANLKLEMAFSLPVKGVIEENYVIDANSTVVLPVNDNLFKALDSEMAYIRYTTDKDLTLSVSQRKNTPCVNSVPFDWTTGVKQEAGKTQWYEMDITSLIKNKQHLRLTLKNHSSSVSLVNLEIAMDCDGEIVPVSLPIPGDLNITQVIDYQILSRSPRNRVYVGVTTTNAAIELAASVKNYIADDQAPCQAAEEVVLGEEYTHAPGTKWYKLSLDLLKSKVKNSSVYFANKNNQRAHVTFGLVTDCMYSTGTTITVPVPAGLEVGATMPNVVGNLLEALEQFANAYNKVDATDLFLEVTTDLPIQFGLDVENTTTNPCLRSDLVTFDWDKGATVQAGKAVWYDMDLTTIKETGKHVKLTFTNHADSLVWATAVVSLDCPAKVTVPVVVPVPANLSVEHVVDYSFFAAVNVDHIYVGVSADGPLELAASTIDATASTVDCSDVKMVASGDTTLQAAGATKLYQLPLSLLDQEGRVAKLTFANQGKETAVIKAGFTVDCQYGIATYATIKVPQDINMSLNIPRRVIAEARRLLDEDITDIYLQITSSQPIAFIVDMQATDTRACDAAELFDWQAWEKDGIQLQANKDLWYKVDLRYPLEKLKNGESLTLSIANNDTVDVKVDVSVSPSCPMLVSYNKLITIPAKKSVSRDLTYDEVIALINRYDKFIYDVESDQFFAKYQTYVVFNKLSDLLGRYAKYVPFGQIEALLAKYGEFLSITGIYELLTNYETYLSVEELKEHLAAQLQYVSYEDLLNAIDAYGKYIPSAKAQELLEEYGDNIPALGAQALVIIQRCEKYITNENLKKVVEYLKGFVPFEELKELFNKIEQYLPTDAGCFVRVKTTSDLNVRPEDKKDYIPEEVVEGYLCDGDEYTHPKTGKTDVMQGQTVVLWRDTVPTADPLKDKVIEHVYKIYTDPTAITTVEDFKKIYVNVDSLTPGVVPSFDKQTILDYYAKPEVTGEGVAKVVDVKWTTEKVACGAEEWPVKFTLITQCKDEDGVDCSVTLPVKKTRTRTFDKTICEGGEGYTWKDEDGNQLGDANPYKATGTYDHQVEFKDSECLELDYTLKLTVLKQPVELTTELFKKLYPTVDSLTPGTTPEFDKQAILDYYANPGDGVAKVTDVAWDIKKIDCGAKTHAFMVILKTETEQCKELPFDITLPVKQTRKREFPVTICEGGEGYTWKDEDGNQLGDANPYKATGTYDHQVEFKDSECLELDYTLKLTVLKQPVELTTELFKKLYPTVDSLTPGTTPEFDKQAILDYYANPGDGVAKVTDVAWDIKKIDCGVQTHTFKVILKTETEQCKELPFDITLPVKQTRVRVFNEQIKQGDSYTWTEGNGQTYKTAVTGVKYEKKFEGSECLQFDYTLNLKVSYGGIKEVTVVDTVCVGTEYQGRLSKKTINQYTEWKDSLRIEVAGVPVDSIYKYQIHTYVTGIPTLEADEVIAICGNAMDVKAAEATIQAYIDADPFFAPVESLVWEVLEDNTWKTMSTAALDGNVKTVTARFTLNTICKSMTSNAVTVEVETPTPENDYEMANIPAYNNYGGRLLTLDIKRIENDLGWNIDIADITWYRVVDAIDDYADETSVKNDEVVGHNYYLEKSDGSPLPAGTYYARVNHNRVTEADCDGIVQTVEVLVSGAEVGMKLAPTMAKPHEIIRLLNMNPAEDAKVTVYSTTGEVMDTFEVKNVTETSFHAAQTAGYYIVEVQTEAGKVSLRYIVK